MRNQRFLDRSQNHLLMVAIKDLKERFTRYWEFAVLGTSSQFRLESVPCGQIRNVPALIPKFIFKVWTFTKTGAHLLPVESRPIPRDELFLAFFVF